MLPLSVLLATAVRTAVTVWVIYARKMDPTEYVSWEGWYWLWLGGILDMGWVLLLALGLHWAVPRLWRMGRRALGVADRPSTREERSAVCPP
jgi:hypothetical protein